MRRQEAERKLAALDARRAETRAVAEKLRLKEEARVEEARAREAWAPRLRARFRRRHAAVALRRQVLPRQRGAGELVRLRGARVEHGARNRAADGASQGAARGAARRLARCARQYVL